MFCDKCGSLLVPGSDGFVCVSCGFKGDDVEFGEKSKSIKEIHMVQESKGENLPKTKTECPKCEHDEAYFFVRQTRSADESPTAFYTCVKCGHKWRDYD